MGTKKRSQAEITKRLNGKNHKRKWLPLSSAEPPSLRMLFGNKYFKLDIVHIDICVLPECPPAESTVRTYQWKKKAISSYGEKKGGSGRQKLKCKIKVALYLCTRTSPRLSSKMLMEVTDNNSSSIHKMINPVLNFFQIDTKEEAGCYADTTICSWKWEILFLSIKS